MSGARVHLRLGHLPKRRVVVGLAFLVEVAASCWLPMARADDGAADPQAAAELAARKRILANWQARQDRIKSFYVASKPAPEGRPAKGERPPDPPGVYQLWMTSQGRFRTEYPARRGTDPMAVGHQQRVFDGQQLRTLWTPLEIVAPDGTLKTVSAAWFPGGTVRKPQDLDDTRPGYGQEMLAFRPLQSPYGDWTLQNSRVTSQNAIVGGRHYVKIEKSNIRSKLTETCWVDPARDDLAIYFQREFSEGTEEWTTLEYKQDPRHGWILTRWQFEYRSIDRRGKQKSTDVRVVSEYRINEDFPSETFQLKFPAGAVVHDCDANRDYFVRRDGSQRMFDRNELGESITHRQLVNEDATRPVRP